MIGSTNGKVLRGNVNKLTELRGYSAYEVAVLEGFIGTEEEWLESLKGEKPIKGVDYFTEEDKKEIAEEAASYLLNGDEVAY